MNNFSSELYIQKFDPSHIKICGSLDEVRTISLGGASDDEDPNTVGQEGAEYTFDLSRFRLVDIAFVGGGGGGGNNAPVGVGGGGGAGGVLAMENVPLLRGKYKVEVGEGGDGKTDTSGTEADSGGDTKLVALNQDGTLNSNHIQYIAIGGGGGGGNDGGPGGSGGGGGNWADIGSSDGGASRTGVNGKDQGNDGANGGGQFGAYSGGGGGAGSKPISDNDSPPDGGEGINDFSSYGPVSLNVPITPFAAGGGGAGTPALQGAGGEGGSGVGGDGATVDNVQDFITPPTKPTGIGCGGGGGGRITVDQNTINVPGTAGSSGYAIVDIKDVSSRQIVFQPYEVGSSPNIDIITSSDWTVHDPVAGSPGKVLSSKELLNTEDSVLRFDVDIGGAGVLGLAYFVSIDSGDEFRIFIDGNEEVSRSGVMSEFDFFYKSGLSSGAHSVVLRVDKNTDDITGLNKAFLDTFAYTL